MEEEECGSVENEVSSSLLSLESIFIGSWSVLVGQLMRGESRDGAGAESYFSVLSSSRGCELINNCIVKSLLKYV